MTMPFVHSALSGGQIGAREHVVTVTSPRTRSGVDSVPRNNPEALKTGFRLPWPRRFLAKAIRGPEPGAQVLEPLPLTRILGPFSPVFLCLSLPFCL